MIKSKIKFAAMIVAAAVSAAFFVHPYGKVKNQNSTKPLFSGAQIEMPLLNIARRSCQNCHSEQTVWPWYSYVPPASWMVEKDVHEARDHFNMSRWDEYSADRRMGILAKISVMIRNRQMPLPRYTWLHPDAKLSDADISLIDQWSHAERRRLRAAAVPQEGN